VREAVVYAVAVAVSPVPIGATLLLLTCPRREANGLSFLAGWAVGVGTLALLFVVLVEASGISDADPLWLALSEIVLGVVFLLTAAVLLIQRGRRPERAAPWINAVDHLTAPRSGGLGLVLSGANPKIAALSLGAALSLAETDASATRVAMSAALFTAIGAVGVAAPLAVHLAAPTRTEPILLRLRSWLGTHETAVLVVLGVVVGGLFVREGVAAL
jgi:hypothetical protein